MHMSSNYEKALKVLAELAEPYPEASISVQVDGTLYQVKFSAKATAKEVQRALDKQFYPNKSPVRVL